MFARLAALLLARTPAAPPTGNTPGDAHGQSPIDAWQAPVDPPSLEEPSNPCATAEEAEPPEERPPRCPPMCGFSPVHRPTVRSA